jgi:hypothetical protein
VYVFYTEHRDKLTSAGLQMVAVLFCRRSKDAGVTWEAPVQVIPDTVYASLPGRGAFAQVPDNQSSEDPGGLRMMPGYFRVARVWSCLDANGHLHVVWFDNRAGKSPETRNWFTQACETDYWRVHRVECGDPLAEQMLWNTGVLEVSGLSIGGTGIPSGLQMRPWCPPGDFLSCDADASYLYVAWPDTSDYPITREDQGRVKLRRIGVQP